MLIHVWTIFPLDIYALENKDNLNKYVFAKIVLHNLVCSFGIYINISEKRNFYLKKQNNLAAFLIYLDRLSLAPKKNSTYMKTQSQTTGNFIYLYWCKWTKNKIRALYPTFTYFHKSPLNRLNVCLWATSTIWHQLTVKSPWWNCCTYLENTIKFDAVQALCKIVHYLKNREI